VMKKPEVKSKAIIISPMTLPMNILLCGALIRPQDPSEKGRVFTDDAFFALKDGLRFPFLQTRGNSRFPVILAGEI